MYEVGDLIVYGRTGICEVTEITTLKMDGVPKDKLYYILRPVREKHGKVFTPVDNEKIVMRKVISKEEAEELIREIPQIEGLWIGSEKQREEKYKECMKSCKCAEWVRIIKTLYQRKMSRLKQGKKITATDERYLRMAEGNLYSELSIALGIPESGMEAYITNQINETEERYFADARNRFFPGIMDVKKMVVAAKKGDFTEHLPLPVFCEKWVLQIEIILCYTVLDKTKNEV